MGLNKGPNINLTMFIKPREDNLNICKHFYDILLFGIAITSVALQLVYAKVLVIPPTAHSQVVSLFYAMFRLSLRPILL